MSSPAERPLESQLLDAVRELCAANASLDQAVATTLGLSPTELQAIGVLTRRMHATAGELSEATGLTTGAITGVVDRLERASFAEREADPADRRKVIVKLRFGVDKKLKELDAPATRSVAEVVAASDPARLRTAIDVMRAIADAAQREAAGMRSGPAGSGQGRRFSAPLGTATSGRLDLVPTGASTVVRGVPDLDGLYEATFPGVVPKVKVRGGHVTLSSSSMGLFSRRSASTFLVYGRIPWDIRVRTGASSYTLTIDDVRLGMLEVTEGASKVVVELPVPTGTVLVRLTGGASNVILRRPRGAEIQISVKGGANKLVFDGEKVPAVAGEVVRDSGGYPTATDRFDVEMTGGANKVTIDTR